MARGFPIGKDGNLPSDIGTTPVEARQALEGIVHGAGLLDGGVVTGTGGWSYSVAPAHIAQRRDVGDGISIGYHPGGTVATDPAPATGSRYDIPYLHQQDVSHSDGNGDLVLGCAIGIPHATTPVEPTLPPGAVRLPRARVSAGNANTGDATISTAGVVYGDVTPVSHGGTGGRTAVAAQRGIGIVNGNAPVGSATTTVMTGTVTFPVAFAAATVPTVLTGPVVTSGGIVIETYAVSISHTQFTLRWIATAAVASAFTVPWVAFGVSA